MLRLFFLILFSQIIFAQVFWKASGETGYYSSNGDFLQSNEEILTRLNLIGGYNFQREKDQGKFEFQLRPELYGFENKLQTTKIGIDGNYSQANSIIDWALNVAANQYFFSGNISNFSYELFFFNGRIVWNYKPQTRLEVNAGYAYRNFNLRDAASLDIAFFEANSSFIYNPFLNLSIGLYAEKFKLKKNDITFLKSVKIQNTGSRFGPLLRFNFTRKFVFSCDYKFLLHNSEVTSYPSFDQWLRIIAGTNIAKNVSIFFMVDYYKKNFKYQENEETEELLYSPVNFENRFYFKLSNALSSDKKIFLKIGYFDEQLFYRNFFLSGWKGYIGFEIRG